MQRLFRLQRTEDFQRLRRAGRTQQHPLMTLSHIPNELPYNRYGFITSKRLGKAVIRNRVRRLLREAVRLLHPQLKSGFDVVIIARHSLAGQPFEVVKSTVEMLCRQSRLVESGAP
jgi:ribonuclease P protein component